MDDAFTVHKEKLKKAKEERNAASGYRRQDLDRYVKRLEEELRVYIRYHKRG